MKLMLPILLLLLSPSVFAKDVYFALSQERSHQLVLDNSASSGASCFLQFRSGSLELVEIPINFTSKGRKKISLNDLAPHAHFLLVKCPSTVRSELLIENDIQFLSFQGQEDLSRQVNFISPSGQKTSLVIANLSPVQNEIEIEDQGKTLSLSLLPFGSKEFSLPERLLLGSVKIKASQRVKVLVFSDHGEITLQRSPENLQKKSDKTYFVFGIPSGPQFTVGLSDPNHIERARNLIKNPNSLGSILSASVKLGTQNHNFALQSHPNWSWEVDEVYGFADFGSTDCNGNAQRLEELVTEWIDGGQFICFWTSKPLKELSP